MPQLDQLSYLSQFVFLLISFLGVYVLVLRNIVPVILTAVKLRRKLNTITSLTSKLERLDFENNRKLLEVHDKLYESEWYKRCQVNKDWTTSKLMVKLCLIIQLTKWLCIPEVQSFKF
jgi:hypothetical protein